MMIGRRLSSNHLVLDASCDLRKMYSFFNLVVYVTQIKVNLIIIIIKEVIKDFCNFYKRPIPSNEFDVSRGLQEFLK